MATEVVRDLADTIIGNGALEGEDTDSDPSAETVIRARDSNSNHLGTTSSYALTANDSVFSRDVDHWIRGDTSPLEAGIQSSRMATNQRSTLVSSSSLDTNLWYFAAMVLPFVSVNETMLWRCTPSTVLNTAELLLTQVARLCAMARSQLRRLAREQAARDLFATAMDIVLVIYAMGFLVLSLYQASLIGR